MIRNPSLIRDVHDACSVGISGIEAGGDLSVQNTLSQSIAKSLLLSCASYYELEITELVRSALRSNVGSKCMLSWLEQQAVDGQFFKWFDFRNAKNVNRFFSLFGVEFRDLARGVIDAREYRRKSESDFMLICIKRNECVHKNYAAYSLDLTVDDLWRKHLSAMGFIRALEVCFSRHIK